jgi:MFS transporter, FHS family, glucose/mannose:H+ symporter
MPQPQRARFLTVLLHLIFFLSGISTVLIGQVLPILARHFSLNDLEVSYFFPAQFTGAVTGTFLASRLGRVGGHMTAALTGGMSMAVGLLTMNADSFAVCLLGFFINGVGIGLTLPSINLMVFEANPLRSGSALSILNFCWGVGAIISKPFVDLLSTPDSIGLTTIALAAPLVATSLMLVPSMRSARAASATESPDVGDGPPIWRMPLAWAIALFNFIHVGFESGMGGWLTTYTERLEGAPFLPWISPTLLYFSFFVAGRGIAPVLYRYLNENRMLFLGLTIILSGMIVTLSAHTVTTLSIGATIAGFGTSWIFPTNVSRFFKTFGPRASRHATPLFVCGTLGAASVTWLIGFLSNRAGELRIGMYALIISVVLLIFLQTVLGLRKSV